MTLMSKCKYESEEKEECLLFDELWCPCSAYEEQKEEEEGKNMTVRYGDYAISDLVKDLNSARNQLLSENVAGIAWIQKAIRDSIIWIQLLQQELYSEKSLRKDAELSLEENKNFLEEVFGRKDIADFCTNLEKQNIRKYIDLKQWEELIEVDEGK